MVVKIRQQPVFRPTVFHRQHLLVPAVMVFFTEFGFKRLQGWAVIDFNDAFHLIKQGFPALVALNHLPTVGIKR